MAGIVPAGALRRCALAFRTPCQLGEIFAEALQRFGVGSQIIGELEASCGTITQMLYVCHVGTFVMSALQREISLANKLRATSSYRATAASFEPGVCT
jgi:hypothetical protein